jgi:hypothetical protein
MSDVETMEKIKRLLNRFDHELDLHKALVDKALVQSDDPKVDKAFAQVQASRQVLADTVARAEAALRLDERAMQGPPRLAELLLTVFASTKHAEAMIGDLNEQYAGWCKRFGVRQARELYWVRAAQSIGPLLLRWLGKVLKWAAVISTVKRALGW